MAALLLTFDLERFILGEDFCSNLSKEQSLQVALEGMEGMLSFFKESRLKATIFVSYDFFQECKPQLKQLARQGNEIALHGCSHSDDYAKMPKSKAIGAISDAKKSLEKGLGITVKGFRAPRMQRLDPAILRQCGFSYDSSLHPTFLPGYYNNFLKPRKVFADNGVKVVPISVAPLLRLPFSWFFFRNFGLGYSKLCSRLSLLNTNFINIYFHNWEFADLGKQRFPEIPKRFTRNSGKSLGKMLQNFTEWCRKKDIQDQTISEFLKL